MILKELLERSEYTLVQGSEDVEISTLVYDSRKIEKGSVFVCISGAAFDGHKFVAQAAELGAAAVVVERKDNNNVYDPCSPRTCRTEDRIDRND